MAAKEKALEDLFHETLKDIYYAEKHILKALPKMAKSAKSAELRQAFEKHREETEGQIERLESVFEMLGKSPRGKTCEAIQGLVEEGKEVMEEFKDSPALDAGILAGAQAVEHYEISRYGTLKTWAGALGMEDAIPENGSNADFAAPYEPNDAGFGQKFKPGLKPAEMLAQ
jgi:ferritin-like metal-binding protein YciE